MVVTCHQEKGAATQAHKKHKLFLSAFFEQRVSILMDRHLLPCVPDLLRDPPHHGDQNGRMPLSQHTVLLSLAAWNAFSFTICPPGSTYNRPYAKKGTAAGATIVWHGKPSPGLKQHRASFARDRQLQGHATGGLTPVDYSARRPQSPKLQSMAWPAGPPTESLHAFPVRPRTTAVCLKRINWQSTIPGPCLGKARLVLPIQGDA